MKKPDYLKKGETVGIISTARKVDKDYIDLAVDVFSGWGLKVKLGENLFNEDNQFAGSDAERAFDLQKMLDDKEVKAIVCAKGGYGTVRIIDQIDFTTFLENPKWILGFSDMTVLHSHIHSNFGIETMHGPIPSTFAGLTEEALLSVKNALFGKELSYTIASDNLNTDGTSKGILVGGNLSILYSLLGSISDIDTDGKILFLEDLDEYLYHVDRMMMALKRAGKLSNLAGLIVGGMTDMNDNSTKFGKNAYEIIIDAVGEYKYPVIFSFPAGHFSDNRVLILGRECEMIVSNDVSQLYQI
ncbi:LD-carboxypeptidase [Bacteroidota bacterium]